MVDVNSELCAAFEGNCPGQGSSFDPTSPASPAAPTSPENSVGLLTQQMQHTSMTETTEKVVHASYQAAVEPMAGESHQVEPAQVPLPPPPPARTAKPASGEGHQAESMTPALGQANFSAAGRKLIDDL